MQRHAIIVAGGSGKRMGAPIPKQFLEVNGAPILVHTLNVFHRFDPTIRLVVVMAKDWMDHWKELSANFKTPDHQLVEGGEERFHSVSNGLASIEGEGVVGIHDAVRPLVSVDTLERCYEKAAAGESVIPVVPVTESLRFVDGDGNKAVERSSYRIVQTPQCFPLSAIRSSFEQGYRPFFTDDASVAESAGFTITTVEGNTENIKITSPQDLVLAKSLLPHD